MTEREEQLTKQVEALSRRLTHARTALKRLRADVDQAIKENTAEKLP